jgi:regulator of replication initiation timing
MAKNSESFLKKTLGDDFLESLGTDLSKSEIYKPGSRTITDTNDLYQGLKIVPRVLLNLLIRELSPMQIGDTKEIKIPMAEDAMIRTTKHERDSFSGEVLQRNVKLVDFLHRSIPGLGLVLLSILELYNIEDLDKESPIDNDQEARIQRLVDERLQMHSLVNQVVDGKLLQRDAVQQLLMSRLNEMSQEHSQIKKEHQEIKEENKPTIVILEPKKKVRPLHNFVENRKNKKEHFIKMEKSETVSCSDCGQDIFSEGVYSGCICFGESKKLRVKKSEDGYVIRFGRDWDIENIEMLLEVLRDKKDAE